MKEVKNKELAGGAGLDAWLSDWVDSWTDDDEKE